MKRTAYVDEAFQAGPDGVYVVAAIFVGDGRAGKLRQELRDLFGDRRPHRFHWHAESAPRRRRMLEFIADRDVSAISVSGCLQHARGQERARAQSLERLLWELRPMQIDRMILESRQDRNNQRDRSTIIAAQTSGKATALLTYEFGRPMEEPLLWMADAIAGAVLATEHDHDKITLAVIAHTLQRITLQRR